MQAIPHLRVRNLSKRFGNFTALGDVSIEIARGEMHCLLGENGAGKSTLTSCLSGYLQADAGTIEVYGQALDIRSPMDARRAGIGKVFQHFVLANPLTVVENVIAGSPQRGFLPRTAATRARLHERCRKYGLSLDLDCPVGDLDVGQQQWAEILKCLNTEVDLLILDEPTAVLTPQESVQLFSVLRTLTGEGTTVVLITHKLDEVLQCDRVTVMRKGRVIDTVEAARCTRDDLSTLMVGHATSTPRRGASSPGAPRLVLEGLSASAGRRPLHGIDLTVHRGEIVGIAGVSGNGQKELFEVIAGARRATAGRLLCDGVDLTNHDPGTISRAGIGHIPQDRFAEGLVGELSVADNLMLGRHRDPVFSRRGFLSRKRAEAFAQDCIDRFAISTRSVHTKAGTLSGGNAQKIVIARELYQASKVVLANQPTRGVDVGVIESIYRLLLDKRNEGYAILLASDELDDLFNLCDRIAVMYEGRIAGIFDATQVTIAQIGHLMAGGAHIPPAPALQPAPCLKDLP
ncbi:ribose ABC transport system ATP-binding protein RbsA [Cupriavidus necator N-1]|uniref:Ribose ABC transport system ATP-binding protein RbsA n=1 Tax=Cupriavidus necator (strain ATCC 43291 / DSM 13513 / CCUG 52238 / LMG 8453 / N-1) TaxID=1042878 RepID=G0ERU9_CUPNN|nr:ABC transporter ATP-binding protein [Cupriavidus necator]AEI75377.1 ribose ABC transport system ATP-binding protein RbsA [Cupriavidus necator N-1]MDX6012478.1 ABC transporter ATP-binding protein [Cupriavidus necator]